MTKTETAFEESFRNAYNATAEKEGKPSIGKPTLIPGGLRYLIKDPKYGMSEIAIGDSGIWHIKSLGTSGRIMAAEHARIALKTFFGARIFRK
jgi:hypothetical protein